MPQREPSQRQRGPDIEGEHLAEADQKAANGI